MRRLGLYEPLLGELQLEDEYSYENLANYKIGVLSGCASGTEVGIDRFKSSSGKRKGSEK